MLLIRILFLLASLTGTTALARIGETADQFSARYGLPKDSPASKISEQNFPLLQGAIHHIYEYEG
jgi:hypothetical protein